MTAEIKWEFCAESGYDHEPAQWVCTRLLDPLDKFEINGKLNAEGKPEFRSWFTEGRGFNEELAVAYSLEEAQQICTSYLAKWVANKGRHHILGYHFTIPPAGRIDVVAMEYNGDGHYDGKIVKSFLQETNLHIHNAEADAELKRLNEEVIPWTQKK
jgi:hypothetical protein